MKYENIILCLNMCIEHINEGGGKITSAMLQSYDFPANVKNLIKENHMIVMKIINFHYDNFKNILKKHSDLTVALEHISFIKKKTNSKKTIMIDYNDIILPWLKKGEFFINIYENNDNQFIPDLSWCRPNQLISMQSSLDTHFISGIDLQCTGAGKTLLILFKALYYIILYNKNVMLICEKKYILENEFSKSNIMKQNNYNKHFNKMNIVNLATDNDIDFHNNIKGTNNLIIVNRAFLSTKNRYTYINKDMNIGLVLVDECHSSSANKTFEILNHIKMFDCSMIGFSATPIRRNKLKAYVDLFGKNNKINYISNYSLFNAIIDNICLPFKIDLFDGSNKNCSYLMGIISKHIITLYYKKIIIWFRKIDECDQYYKYFQDNFPDKTIKLFISHSNNDINDNQFITMEKNCIMFCVNRFREGSNMPTLELGVLLDANICRGEIPTIQMCGRLLRCDSNNIKKSGHIIDFCSKSNIIEKIIKYYVDMTNCENIMDIIDFVKNNIIVMKDTKQIIFKLNEDKQIEINFKTVEIDWSTIKDDIIKEVKKLLEYDIYLVPGGKISMGNFNKTVKTQVSVNNMLTSVWGCKENKCRNLKPNDRLIFNLGDTIEFYYVKEVIIDPDLSMRLWNDKVYVRVFPIGYLGSYKCNRKELNHLIGYPEAYVVQSITRIANISKQFKDWYEQNCPSYAYNMIDSENDIEV